MIAGFAKVSNEVQHPDKVLAWDKGIISLRLRSGVELPSFMKLGNRTGKSRQVWIARHRALRVK